MRKFFSLSLKFSASHYLFWDRKQKEHIMPKKLMIIITTVMFGTSVYGAGCSEMAAFNTKIDKALKTASFSQQTKTDLNKLVNECGRMHGMGMAVNTVDACNKALKLVAVN